MCVCACIYLYTYVHIYIFIYLFVYLYIYIRVCIYIYICTPLIIIDIHDICFTRPIPATGGATTKGDEGLPPAMIFPYGGLLGIYRDFMRFWGVDSPFFFCGTTQTMFDEYCSDASRKHLHFSCPWDLIQHFNFFFGVCVRGTGNVHVPSHPHILTKS